MCGSASGRMFFSLRNAILFRCFVCRFFRVPIAASASSPRRRKTAPAAAAPKLPSLPTSAQNPVPPPHIPPNLLSALPRAARKGGKSFTPTNLRRVPTAVARISISTGSARRKRAESAGQSFHSREGALENQVRRQRCFFFDWRAFSQ